MSSTKWACAVCTFENSAGFTCGICNTVDAGRRAALSSATNATSPTRGTSGGGGGGGGGSSIMGGMGMGRPSGGPTMMDDTPTEAGWSCGACTMFNIEDEDNDECTVCGTVNQQRIDDRAAAEEKRRVDEEKKKAEEEAKRERIAAEKKRAETERRARLVPHYWKTFQVLDGVTPFVPGPPSSSSSSGGVSRTNSSGTNGTSMMARTESGRATVSAKRSISRTTSSGTNGTSVEKKARAGSDGSATAATPAAPSSPVAPSSPSPAPPAPEVDAVSRPMMTDLYTIIEHKAATATGPLTSDACTTRAMDMTTCGHRTICRACLAAHIRARIDAKDVVPWIPCPAECRAPIHPIDLMRSEVSAYDQWRFMNIYLSKILPRCEEWVECKTDKCGFGWWVTDLKKTKKTCDRCRREQTVERKKEELDEEFKKMIANGTIRPCPKCQLHTMKEKGICNIINCAKCSIWWNWKTKETGNNQSDLKNRARANGSLWEPGELHYQQNLERSNPEEFRKLLERNGMKYDPNYVRGT